MNKAPEKQIIDILHGQQPAFRNFSQEFICRGQNISHQHHLQVELIESQGEKFQILNHHATITQGQLKKVIQIQIQNRIIKIIDTFLVTKVLDNRVKQLDSKIQNKKPRRVIFLKSFSSYKKQVDMSPLKFRNTKNLVKKVIGLFRLWITQNSLNLSELCDLCQTLNKSRYNNKLNIDISKDSILRKLFILFSQKQGEAMINQSKIRDKQIHFQALKRYKRICDDQESFSSRKNQSQSNSESNKKQQI